MAIYRRSGVNTEGICYKSVGYFLPFYIYIYIYKSCEIIVFILADQLLTCCNAIQITFNEAPPPENTSSSVKLLPQ